MAMTYQFYGCIAMTGSVCLEDTWGYGSIYSQMGQEKSAVTVLAIFL